MVFLTDQIGRTQQCKYLVETATHQAKTNEIFFTIIGIGYDGIRRTDLFTFNNEEQMHKKYLELYQDYMQQSIKEMSQ